MRRKLTMMIKSMSNSLPYDSRVEYLESNGTQYINTGIIQTSLDFELTLKFKWVGSTLSTFETFVGYLGNSSSYPRFSFNKYSSKWMFGTNATRITSISADSNEHTIKVICNSNDNTEHLYIDDVEVESGTVSYTSYILNNTLSFFLFARNANGTAGNKAIARIMQFEYKEFTDSSHVTTSLENNFIPVRISNIGYMFDQVSRQLFGNSGTGSFIIGNDI